MSHALRQHMLYAVKHYVWLKFGFKLISAQAMPIATVEGRQVETTEGLLMRA